MDQILFYTAMLFGTCALLLLIFDVSHGHWDLAALNAALFVTNVLIVASTIG